MKKLPRDHHKENNIWQGRKGAMASEYLQNVQESESVPLRPVIKAENLVNLHNHVKEEKPSA